MLIIRAVFTGEMLSNFSFQIAQMMKKGGRTVPTFSLGVELC